MWSPERAAGLTRIQTQKLRSENILSPQNISIISIWAETFPSSRTSDRETRAEESERRTNRERKHLKDSSHSLRPTSQTRAELCLDLWDSFLITFLLQLCVGERWELLTHPDSLCWFVASDLRPQLLLQELCSSNTKIYTGTNVEYRLEVSFWSKALENMFLLWSLLSFKSQSKTGLQVRGSRDRNIHSAAQCSYFWWIFKRDT